MNWNLKKMICYLKKRSERSYKGLYKKYLHYCIDFVFGTNISFRSRCIFGFNL